MQESGPKTKALLKPYFKCEICDEWILAENPVLIGHIVLHTDDRKDWIGLIKHLFEAEFPKYT